LQNLGLPRGEKADPQRPSGQRGLEGMRVLKKIGRHHNCAGTTNGVGML